MSQFSVVKGNNITILIYFDSCSWLSKSICCSCFLSAWKSHCQNRHVALNFSNPRNTSTAVQQQGFRDVIEEYPVELSGKGVLDGTADAGQLILLPSTAAYSSSSISNEYSDWQTVSTEKSYTPTFEDIGSVLRVDVKAMAVNGGHLLAGPVTIVSDTILAHPRPPPKRSLLTVGNTSSLMSAASSAGARFRVISYNILAELYATKQVCRHYSWLLVVPIKLID